MNKNKKTTSKTATLEQFETVELDTIAGGHRHHHYRHYDRFGAWGGMSFNVNIG